MEHAKNAEGQFPGHRPSPSLRVTGITLLRSHRVLISAPQVPWPGTPPVGFVKWKLWFCDKCPEGRPACHCYDPVVPSMVLGKALAKRSRGSTRLLCSLAHRLIHSPNIYWAPTICCAMLDLGMQRRRSHSPSSSGQGRLPGQWPFSDHCFGRMKLEVEGDHPASNRDV